MIIFFVNFFENINYKKDFYQERVKVFLNFILIFVNVILNFHNCDQHSQLVNRYFFYSK